MQLQHKTRPIKEALGYQAGTNGQYVYLDRPGASQGERIFGVRSRLGSLQVEITAPATSRHPTAWLSVHQADTINKR